MTNSLSYILRRVFANTRKHSVANFSLKTYLSEIKKLDHIKHIGKIGLHQAIDELWRDILHSCLCLCYRNHSGKMKRGFSTFFAISPFHHSHQMVKWRQKNDPYIKYILSASWLSKEKNVKKMTAEERKKRIKMLIRSLLINEPEKSVFTAVSEWLRVWPNDSYLLIILNF